MKVIEKKTWPDSFQKILSGEKTYDIRLADWRCAPGDVIEFREYDPKLNRYTGRSLRKVAGYVGKTKDWRVWPEEDIRKHGFQIISLLPEEQK